MAKEPPSSPPIDPANFSTNITNPYFPLRPGTTYVYEDTESGVTDTVVVTRDTVAIMGVTCVVVHDTATIDGQVVEDTFDWYAQDDLGNVWYFGEDTKEFEPGNPIPISTEGSWIAGVDGAQPGVIMEVNPQVGDVYKEELAPGVAEDEARVMSLDQNVDVVYGSFDDVLKTKNFTPLDPGNLEHKYYVPGVGFVLGTSGGNQEQLIKIIINGTAGKDNLTGYAGGDEMHGDAGKDSLIGGAGNDLLFGENGADSFVFQELINGVIETDIIADYSKNQGDVIDLPQGALSIATDSLVDSVWQLTLNGDGDVIVLDGLTDLNNDGHIVDDLLIV